MKRNKFEQALEIRNKIKDAQSFIEDIKRAGNPSIESCYPELDDIAFDINTINDTAINNLNDYIAQLEFQFDEI